MFLYTRNEFMITYSPITIIEALLGQLNLASGMEMTLQSLQETL